MEAMKSPGPHGARSASVTCAGRNRAGRRCKLPPIPGGWVCLRHGGGAPQVQRAAFRRLAEAKMREEVSALGYGGPGGDRALVRAFDRLSPEMVRANRVSRLPRSRAENLHAS